MTSIAENLAEIRRRIASAAERAGRDPSAVTLVAVSKMQGIDAILEAYQAGQRHFAENYAQHLRDKSTALKNLPELHWHFIGNLQRNKIKYATAASAIIETVDSIALAEDLNQSASRTGRMLDCLVQINIGREAQKSGAAAEEAEPLLSAVESASHLRLRGLMTIPPYDLEPEQTRPYFVALRKLRDERGGPSRLPELSMGMSGDFEQAVEEGATIVRVGTAVFGFRN